MPTIDDVTFSHHIVENNNILRAKQLSSIPFYDVFF